ncbi:MAG: hypothetical protein ABSB31_08280 [Dehalococcoidia bacterium]|jgi:hypothetical protein
MMRGLTKKAMYITAGIHQYSLAAKQLKNIPAINSKNPTVKVIKAMNLLFPSSNHRKLSKIKISEKLAICSPGVSLISEFMAKNTKAITIIKVPYSISALLGSGFDFHHLKAWNKKIIPIPTVGNAGAMSVSQSKKLFISVTSICERLT